MNALIADNLEAIRALCLRYGVRRLDLFGSATSDRFDQATSDLDFVAAFSDTRTPGYAFRYIDFADALEALLGRSVDVVTERSIKSPYFRASVDASRQRIYGE